MGTVTPIRVECACGSGKVGAPRGSTGHIKRCAAECENCAPCKAGRFTPRAKQREGRIARKVGGTRSPGSRGSDVLGAVCDIEETTQSDIAVPLFRWWISATVQKKVASLMKRNYKPRMFWVNRDQHPEHGLVVMPGADALHLLDLARRAEEHR